jgi:protein phosphatase PTC6
MWRRGSIRGISQYLTIHSTNARSPINFQVNLLKVPSNFGYYTSRVNRLYNEDRWQVAVLDLDPGSLRPQMRKVIDEPKGKGNGGNEPLVKEIQRESEPTYTATSPPIDRAVFAFGVFDGHGGDECSTYLRNHLFENVEKLNLSEQGLISMMQFYNTKISGYWKRWSRKIGDVIIKSCKIDGKVKEYVRMVNVQHLGLTGAASENVPGSFTYEIDRDDDMVRNLDEDDDYDHLSRNENLNLIDWDDVINGKKFWEVISMMIEDGELSHWEIFKLRVWASYLFTDIQFLSFENERNEKFKSTTKLKDPQDINQRLIRSGSTCTSAFVYPLKWKNNDNNHYFYMDDVVSRLLIAHVGDTRAIICDKNGLAHSLTKDHHPSNPIEASRLRKLSAGLIMTDSFGEERFLNFANTRSFGDVIAKNVGISAEPEFSDFIIGNRSMIEEYKRENAEELKYNDVKELQGDECFIVIVSDGVTNYLSDQEMVDLVMNNFNNRGSNKGNPNNGAAEVVQFVEMVNGDDNATCLVVRLAGWGKWPIQDRTGKLREERMMDVGKRSNLR